MPRHATGVARTLPSDLRPQPPPVRDEWPQDAVPLERFTARLREAVAGDEHDDRLSALVHHLIGGGKHLRPRLVLLTAAAVDPSRRDDGRVVDAAVAVELLHLASLYHDDVLDRAGHRRGRPTANALWGNRVAVLGGDALLAHAFRVATGLGDAALVPLCQVMLELCRGQVAEADDRFDRDRSVARYEASIAGKTAALIATSCQIGATIAGGDDETARALREYGRHLGLGFQIVDDLLDLLVGSELLGKPAENDLREGVYTLPVLLAIEADPTVRELLTPEITPGQVDEARRRATGTGAVQRAIERAAAHVDAALAQLSIGALAVPARRALTALAGRTLQPLAAVPGLAPLPAGAGRNARA